MTVSNKFGILLCTALILSLSCILIWWRGAQLHHTLCPYVQIEQQQYVRVSYLSVLVVIAQFGPSQLMDALQSLHAIESWQDCNPTLDQVCFTVHVVWLCDTTADLAPYLPLYSNAFRARITVMAYPSDIGEMLLMQHRQIMYDRRSQYDVFVFLEGDMYITRQHMLAWHIHSQYLNHTISHTVSDGPWYNTGWTRYEQHQATFADQTLSLVDLGATSFVPDAVSVYRVGQRTYLDLVLHPYQASYAAYQHELDYIYSQYGSQYLDITSTPIRYDVRADASGAMWWHFGFVKLVPCDQDEFASLMIAHQGNKYNQWQAVTWHTIMQICNTTSVSKAW